MVRELDCELLRVRDYLRQRSPLLLRDGVLVLVLLLLRNALALHEHSRLWCRLKIGHELEPRCLLDGLADRVCVTVDGVLLVHVVDHLVALHPRELEEGAQRCARVLLQELGAVGSEPCIH